MSATDPSGSPTFGLPASTSPDPCVGTRSAASQLDAGPARPGSTPRWLVVAAGTPRSLAALDQNQFQPSTWRPAPNPTAAPTPAFSATRSSISTSPSDP